MGSQTVLTKRSQLSEQARKHPDRVFTTLHQRRNQLYKWKEEIEKRGKQAFPGKGRHPTKATHKEESERLKRALAKAEVKIDNLKKPPCSLQRS